MNDFDRDLERVSNILQILSYQILVSDFNNADLMRYLEHQDNLLASIIKQNNEIIQLLKEGNNGYRENNSKNS